MYIYGLAYIRTYMHAFIYVYVYMRVACCRCVGHVVITDTQRTSTAASVCFVIGSTAAHQMANRRKTPAVFGLRAGNR